MLFTAFSPWWKKRKMTTPWLQALQTRIALHKSGFLFSSIAFETDSSFCEGCCPQHRRQQPGAGAGAGSRNLNDISPLRDTKGHGPDPRENSELFSYLHKHIHSSPQRAERTLKEYSAVRWYPEIRRLPQTKANLDESLSCSGSWKLTDRNSR